MVTLDDSTLMQQSDAQSILYLIPAKKMRGRALAWLLLRRMGSAWTAICAPPVGECSRMSSMTHTPMRRSSSLRPGSCGQRGGASARLTLNRRPVPESVPRPTL